MVQKSIFVVFLIGAISVSYCLAKEAVPTNLELVEMAARQAVDSITIGGARMSNPRLYVEMQSAGEASWLLDNLLKEKLLNLGWQVVSGQAQSGARSDTTSEGYKLNVQVIELGLHYGKVWRRYLLAGKMVERIARVALYYELIDGMSGEVLEASNSKAEVRDVVPASLLGTLAETKYGFAKPELQKTTWDRYLEGGLVLTIIGVLVYLFYSNKTAS